MIEYSPKQRVKINNLTGTVVDLGRLRRRSDGVLEEWCAVRYDRDGAEAMIRPSELEALS